MERIEKLELILKIILLVLLLTFFIVFNMVPKHNCQLCDFQYEDKEVGVPELIGEYYEKCIDTYDDPINLNDLTIG